MTQDSPSKQDGQGRHRAPPTLPEICYTLQRKMTDFLDEQTDDEVLRNVQGQARASMAVIDEALRRYGWVLAPSTPFPSQCPSVTRPKKNEQGWTFERTYREDEISKGMG